MEKIDMTFVRIIENKLEDCTNPIQFREILEKFKIYLYNGQISLLFQTRLEILKGLKVHLLGTEIFDTLEEELENEITLTCTYSPNQSILKRKSTKGRKKDKPLEGKSVITIDIHVASYEGLLMTDVRAAIIKIALEKSLGKKKEACRILGIPMQELTDCIKHDDVRKHLKHVKGYVKSNIIKNKTLDI